MKYLVETHPCAVVHGTIDIPDDEKDPARIRQGPLQRY